MSPILLQLLLGGIQLLTELLRVFIGLGLEQSGWHLWVASPVCIPLPYCLLQGILCPLQILFGSV